MIRMGLWTLGRKTIEIKYYSHHIISGRHTVNVTADAHLHHLAEVMFGTFLPCKFTSPCMHTVLLGEGDCAAHS